jgi:hypothetical protein
MHARPRLSILLLVVVAASAVLSVFLWRAFRPPARPSSPPLGIGHLPDLVALQWVNGRPLPLDSLAARPIALVVFSDTDPQAVAVLRAAEGWFEGYGDLGIRVIGVHAPHFAFAADTVVTSRIARRAGARFPVALDPSLTVENVLGPVAAGPRVAVFDARGALIANGAGREALATAERALRDELRRLRPAGGFPGDPGLTFASAPMPRVRFVHLGAGRSARGPLATAEPGRMQVFTAQFRHQVEGERDVPYPVGRWIPEGDGIRAAAAGAANFLAIRYDAGRVSVVASPPPEGGARLWILRDEKWLAPGALGEDARLDPSGASYVDVSEPRLYSVATGGGEHVLKLSPGVPGVVLHAVTFESGARRARP